VDLTYIHLTLNFPYYPVAARMQPEKPSRTISRVRATGWKPLCTLYGNNVMSIFVILQII